MAVTFLCEPQLEGSLGLRADDDQSILYLLSNLSVVQYERYLESELSRIK